MRAAVLHGPRDVRVETLPDPRLERPTDAILRVTAACVCGSDLWRYRGIAETDGPRQMGHEYLGVVEAVGADVTQLSPGDVVVGSFITSDNTCEACRNGYQSQCIRAEGVGAAQAELLRVSNADGTLVVVPGVPTPAQEASLLAASDVLGTGWFGAVAAQAGPGRTIAVVGDGAVGLMAVLAAQQLGAERIIVMSRHETRSQLAVEYGATDVLPQRGDDGAAAVKELTGGLGAHATIEAVGTQESFLQAMRSTRPGGRLAYLGVAHQAQIPGIELFRSSLQLVGGPAPVRRFLPDLVARIMADEIDPGRVFDREFALDDIAAAYEAMDARTAVKALVLP